MTTKYKFSNRILSLVLAIVIVIGVTPITGLTVSAAAADDVWDGTKASQAWESGGGTAADPYVIMTAAQLAKLASNVNSGTKYNDVYFTLKINCIAVNKGSSVINVNIKNKSCNIYSKLQQFIYSMSDEAVRTLETA